MRRAGQGFWDDGAVKEGETGRRKGGRKESSVEEGEERTKSD